MMVAEGGGAPHSCCCVQLLQLLLPAAARSPLRLREASRVDQLVVGAGTDGQQHHRQERLKVKQRRHGRARALSLLLLLLLLVWARLLGGWRARRPAAQRRQAPMLLLAACCWAKVVQRWRARWWQGAAVQSCCCCFLNLLLNSGSGLQPSLPKTPKRQLSEGPQLSGHHQARGHAHHNVLHLYTATHHRQPPQRALGRRASYSSIISGP